MFLEYLRDKEEDIKGKIDLKKKERGEASFELKENKRFLELLEKEQSTPFTEFTPQVVSATEKRMQEELLEQGRNLQEKRDGLDGEIAVLEEELSRVSEAIKTAKNAVRSERTQRKEESRAIKEKLHRIVKEGEYNPAKAISSLRKMLQEMEGKR